jgi:hypothetical protein
VGFNHTREERVQAMISRSNLGAGYALVHVAPNNNPNQGGGPIRRAPGSNVVYAHAGSRVERSPLLVVREAEPGASWPEDLAATMMISPDGHLVPQTAAAVDMFRGAPAYGAPMEVVGYHGSAIKSLIPAVAMFAGGFAGYKMSANHKGWGTLSGAIVGGVLGLIFR